MQLERHERDDQHRQLLTARLSLGSGATPTEP